MQKVRLAALSLQCSSAPPSVLARRSCARFADAGVPGLLLLLCFASGLELPQMRALSIAVAIALRRHVRSCSPRVLHHTHPVDLACFVQVSMSAIQRGAVVVWHAVLPLENSVVHKIFSRGCAPHPLSLETRFSLYHIKVLHLLVNRLCPRSTAAERGRSFCSFDSARSSALPIASTDAMALYTLRARTASVGNNKGDDSHSTNEWLRRTSAPLSVACVETILASRRDWPVPTIA